MHGFVTAAGLGLCAAMLVAAACTPAQLATVAQDATAIAPGLQAGCALAGDTGPSAPYLDLICAGAEAADAALQKLPQGTAAIVQVVQVTAPSMPDAAPAARLPMYRLRVLLARTTEPRISLDAGGQ